MSMGRSLVDVFHVVFSRNYEHTKKNQLHQSHLRDDEVVDVEELADLLHGQVRLHAAVHELVDRPGLRVCAVTRTTHTAIARRGPPKTETTNQTTEKQENNNKRWTD